MKPCLKILVCVAVAVSQAACGGRSAAWDVLGEMPEKEAALVNEAELLNSEGDAFWQERHRAESVRDAIVRWEQSVAIDPTNHFVWAKLAGAYGLLSSRHLADDGDERVEAAGAGLEAAERSLMALSPEFTERMQRGASLAEGLDVLGVDALEALYWYAVNLDVWQAAQSRFRRMRHGDEVELVMARIIEIDESHGHAAAHRFLGSRRAASSDLDEAEEHLARAVELSPEYLLNHLSMAEEIAVARGDRSLFEEHIAFILEADDDILPEHVPEALWAKERARELLGDSEALFQ